ncbi:MAG: hypothetical protein E6J90_33425 [Deltaproteobacteria bacterium]|nr:MAG: hypothetical protein E6J90_33425 [Deltaproteobacteria bacterium]
MEKATAPAATAAGATTTKAEAAKAEAAKAEAAKAEAAKAEAAKAEAAKAEAAKAEAAKAFLSGRLVVLKDDFFGFFSRTATEIRHRVKIDSNTGTAASSGPWTEEHLPAETLLHGLVIGRHTRYVDRSNRNPGTEAGTGDEVDASAALKTLRDVLRTGNSLRFGGKATAGMGRARMQVAP